MPTHATNKSARTLRELKCLRTVKQIRPIYAILTETRNDRKVQPNAEIQMRGGRGGDEKKAKREGGSGKWAGGGVAESYVNCRHVNLNHDLHLSRDDATALSWPGLFTGRSGENRNYHFLI